ncbi:hypothetical protein M413DRAFT_21769 [Hebeloma cylindrosporum]|uniref:Xylanolytic transcriptional activator regulatory domain-containing protein n=1 Tax=Hebeloma cylindrosporum TaxID=76867 RepID=A0A0C3D0E2_HEBCY|nr:hypothetical protein M413DRAFT_21769 [Hebeloma cylindrosporum h7]
MKRTNECVYDDNSKKSHTRKLREHQEALEARLRELESEHRNCRPSTSNSASVEAPIPTILPQPAAWDIFDTSTTFPSIDPSWDFHIRPSSSSSATLSDRSVSIPLGFSYHANLSGAHSVEFGGPSVYDGTPERVLHEPTLSVEMHNSLIQMFIKHRKQCCFYTNVSRFDPSSSATVYQNSPPSSALMSVIYLLGSFFAGVKSLEGPLLEQTLLDVTRVLHNQEQSVDTVQALCLLAEYFYFNNRDMEGSRHLNTAKRLSLDRQLHRIIPPTFLYDVEFQSDFALWDSVWRERAAAFWQVFMVDSLWSATSDCSLHPDPEFPCPNIITPLPIEDGLDPDLAFGNSTIHSLFEGDTFQGSSLSVTAFKAMAAGIFDRSIRLHNTSKLAPRDPSLWAYYHSTEMALQRLSAVVHPLTWPEPCVVQVPSFDMDLYVVHTLIVASTIHLHLDHVMDLKMSWAANRVVELIHNLTIDDFQFLDPVLALCWSTIFKAFNHMINTESTTKGDVKGGRLASCTTAFLHPCLGALYSALQNISVNVPIAEHFLTTLEINPALLYPLI